MSEARAAGERRQLTVMFCDLVGSTALSGQLDPEDLREVVRAYQHVCAEAISQVDGYLAKYLGDGVLAYFGYPRAHEDDPARAVRAAIAIIGGMGRLPLVAGKERLQVRIGIHTGLVVAGEMGAGETREQLAIVGEAPNVAARLQSLAGPGCIVISDATHQLVRPYFECEILGARDIKGVAEQVLVHRVRCARPVTARRPAAASGSTAPLFGREAEVKILSDEWQHATHGVRVVHLLGDAGIGKTRLADRFVDSASPVPIVYWMHCLQESRAAAFFPLIQLLRAALRLDERRTPQAHEIAQGLRDLGIPPADHLPPLQLLLGESLEDFAGSDPEILGLRVRHTVKEVLKAHRAPVLLVVEDLQWIDSASEEFLASAAGGGDDLRLLLLCTSRPGYVASWPKQAKVRELVLGPLDKESLGRIARAGLGDPAGESRGWEQLVIEKAQGNPFFAEELALQLARRKRSVSTSAPGDLDLPVNLENLMMERISRLPERARAALQAAAVVGQRFAPGLAARVAGEEAEFTAALAELQGQGLVVAEPDGGCTFKHGLIRDAAYQNMLKKRREELHMRAARCIEDLHAGGTAEVADALAEHYMRASVADKAVTYLALAGERSLRFYALDEAELRFNLALELIRGAPGCAPAQLHVDVLLSLARIQYFRGNMRGIVSTTHPHLALVEDLGDPSRLARFLFEIGYAYVFAGRHSEGRPLLERALAIGRQTGNTAALGYASLGLAWLHGFWGAPDEGRFETATGHGKAALDAGKQLGDVWLASKALLFLSAHAGVWGRTGQALHFNKELFGLAEETRDPRPEGMALYGLAMMLVQREEHAAARDHAERAMATSVSDVDRMFGRIAQAAAAARGASAQDGRRLLEALRQDMEEREFRIIALLGTEIPYGVALVGTGSIVSGLRHIRRSSRRYQALGQPFARCYGELALGKVYATISRLGASADEAPLRARGIKAAIAMMAARMAVKHLGAAIAEARRLGITSRMADALFDLGTVHAARGRPAQARVCFQDAREAAMRADAQSLLQRVVAAEALLGSTCG